MKRAVFIGEGSSDGPLADIVVTLLRRGHFDVDMSTPDFERLPRRNAKDVASKIEASLQLTTAPIDLFVVHRDSDGSGSAERRRQIVASVESAAPGHRHLSVAPVRMTEAWLLLDEQAIRWVAGNPSGRAPLGLPGIKEVERRANAKSLLVTALLEASGESGRRRERVARRFNEHRRQLLERLDLDGEVTKLRAWQELIDDVEAALKVLM